MKISKYLLGFLLIIFSLLYISSPVLADSTEELENEIVVFEKSEEDIEIESKLQEKQIIQDLIRNQPLTDGGVPGGITTLNDVSSYKTEYGTPVTKSVYGFAGNQPYGGIRFTTGGGFSWANSGGPSTTLNVSFPTPYASLSVAIPLGNRSTSVTGYFVKAPNTTDYFKLHVSKKYKVTPYVTYVQSRDWMHRIVWTKVGSGHTRIHVSTTLGARKS
ncbi:hypothetical protein [Planomicrobium sp. MB-3u-38]|uniref:hypothetical protein n=1 Tax=Planomicrobium sp. MB-3u-38 TaxID=2058318 RepID=UPI000C7DB7B4|nr:hypothetical protein [Planomicrobium sp. MB-3u-38]PKH10316.1 hypothetical protein CXF70_10350 [Planomicrobium sp. MB-3u-38]